MSLLRRAARGVRERRFFVPSGGGDPWTIPTNGSLAAYTAAGVPVTEETAMQLIAVYACVRIISTALSGLPLDAVRMQGEVRRPLDPPPLIVSDPFGGTNSLARLTRRVGIQQMAVSCLLRGNAYAVVLQRDRYYRPTMLQVLHPDRVDVALDATGRRQYTVNRTPVDAEDIVHIAAMAPPESPKGVSVIQAARQSIGLGLAAEEFGSRFFGSGAHMSGIVQVPGDLDRERARQLKDSFQASHGGLSNAHTVGVLTGGAEWKPISVTPEDAQFLGTRAAQNLDIAMLFGIPPHMLGQVDRTTSWGTGIEQQSLGFLKYTLASWIGLFEDAWSAMLPAPQVAKFNVEGLLRTDTAGRFAVYMMARNAGLLTIDEIRAKEDLAPLPDGAGADPFVPLNSSASGLSTDGTDPGAQTPKSAAESGKEP
ncbi:phage portal protein [Kitasatospora sp. NPDC004669]|uniref:phage portal protein n=1 Tax=Kitasatospora sp. NPDC004669 TaxID=3154555 RepID=UPI0033AD3856